MEPKPICVRCGMEIGPQGRYGTCGPLCPQHCWTPPAIECRPIRWTILDVWHPAYGQISGGIEVQLRVHARTGQRAYAVVCRDHYYLDKAGQWGDDRSWSNETRWDDFDEAVEAATVEAAKIIREAREYG